MQRALELGADALLVAKHGVDGVYDSDPRVNPAATRYTRLTYDEALAARVRVMDTSASSWPASKPSRCTSLTSPPSG